MGLQIPIKNRIGGGDKTQKILVGDHHPRIHSIIIEEVFGNNLFLGCMGDTKLPVNFDASENQGIIDGIASI